MNTKTTSHIKNILFPCFLLSGVAGIFTGIVIFLFKAVSTYVISFSGDVYAFVRENPAYLPVLIGGALLIGLAAALLLHIEPNSKGGGIPTAVCIVRGLFEFRWLRSILMIFPSAMLTYLCGVPLGNEGPSVQMGTAAGRGAVSLFGGRFKAWDRYIMTGGACAGFAAATGAPLSGIFFAFEEAHRRFSPLLFMTSAMSVVFGMLTISILGSFTGFGVSMFDFVFSETLPLGSMWMAAVVGAVCGIAALFFTKAYRFIGQIITKKLTSIPLAVKIMAIFGIVAVVGFFSNESIGSGHHLTEELVHGHGIWYSLILFFCIRALLLIVANNAGVTGGLFLPTLAFGAILGALCADILVKTGVLLPEYYGVMVTVGMAAFMSASARTPIMAITFGAEALCGFANILPLIIGATVAFVVIEASGEVAFSDTVMEKKVKNERAGREAEIIDAYFTVKEGSFAEGHEIRDILWPPSCVIKSVRKNGTDLIHTHGLAKDDILHIHYQTYDSEYTRLRLSELLGEQDADTREKKQPGGEAHSVPEI